MIMSDLKVEVVGLAQISRSLKAVDAQAPKELRIALNTVSDVLIGAVRPKIPEVSGASRRSLVARSTRTSARIAVGGKTAPWYPWLDFGGQGRIKGRPAPREFIREGRYLYPTLREIRPRIEQELRDAITRVIENAGLVVD